MKPKWKADRRPDTLTPQQHAELELELGRPVTDRWYYSNDDDILAQVSRVGSR